MRLLDELKGLQELSKADAPASPASPASPAAPSAPASPGGGGPVGGPGSSPKAGHKYLKRWWAGDHWEYQYDAPTPGKYVARYKEDGEDKYAYQDDPIHGSQGIGESYKQEHTMEVPEGVTAIDPRMAYKQSMERGPHLESGFKTLMTSPLSGQTYEVSLSISETTGKSTLKFVPTTKEGEKRGPDKKRVTDEAAPLAFRISRKEGASPEEVWANVKQFFKAQEATAEAVSKGQLTSSTVKGPGGDVHAVVLRMDAGYDPVSNTLKDDRSIKNQRNWTVAIAKNSPLADYFKGDKLRYKTAERADYASRKLTEAVHRIEYQKKYSYPPVQDRVSRGENPTDIFLQGQVPFGEVRRGKGAAKNIRAESRFGNDFGTPETRLQVARDIGLKYKDAVDNLLGANSNSNVSLSSSTEDIENMDPNSVMVASLLSVVDSYSPATSDLSIEQALVNDLENRSKYRNLVEKYGKEVVEDKLGSEDEASSSTSPLTDSSFGQSLRGREVEGFGQHRTSTVDEVKNTVNDINARLEDFSRNRPQYEAITTALKEVVNNMRSVDLSSAKTDEQAMEVLRPWAEARNQLSAALKDHPEVLSVLNEEVFGLTKSMIKAIEAIRSDEIEKANFTYSHKEGNEIRPKFAYKDEIGNISFRNNAPIGHSDYSSEFGDPAEEDELNPQTAPQFYTRDGRKLSRAPFTGVQVEWNQNYHREDPKNLWAGRWVNPVTGEHEYAYIDSDLRENKFYAINRANALIDNRLPLFRRYVSALFKSHHQKDKIVAVILALIDQGRFRVRELMSLRVGDVSVHREVIKIGNRPIHGDSNLHQQLGTLTSNRHPMEPLFMVTPVTPNGDMDYSSMRRIGPHFVVNLLEELGLPAEALQTYHASQTYSSEIQRIFCSSNSSYESAHMFSLLEVASEMGHNLDHVEDYEMALKVIESSVVDPIVIQAIKQNCQKLGVGMRGDYSSKRPVYSAVPHVSMTLTGRTEEEEEFSKWLRMVPVHLFQGAAG